MRSVALSFLIAFLAAPLGETKQHSTFRVHAQANAPSGPAFSPELKFLGRPLTIQKVLTVSENDMALLQKGWPPRRK
jgi:hypothetical protein